MPDHNPFGQDPWPQEPEPEPYQFPPAASLGELIMAEHTWSQYLEAQATGVHQEGTRTWVSPERQEIQDAKADAERRLARRSRRYTWIALVLVFLVTGVLAGLGGYYVGYDQGHEQGVRHTNQVWLDSWNQYHQAPEVPAPAPTTEGMHI